MLTDHGLRAAVEALASRLPLPVEIVETPSERLPEPVEAAVYYTIAEALTNIAKHARATSARVAVTHSDKAGDRRRVRRRCRWVPTSEPAREFAAWRDRVEVLGGRLEVTSPVGVGTTLYTQIPASG